MSITVPNRLMTMPIILSSSMQQSHPLVGAQGSAAGSKYPPTFACDWDAVQAVADAGYNQKTGIPCSITPHLLHIFLARKAQNVGTAYIHVILYLD